MTDSAVPPLQGPALVCRRTEEAEKQAERPLLADDLDHPPTADLSHLSPGISRSTSLEMTEARHSHLRDLSEAAEGGSGGLKSGSVRLYLLEVLSIRLPQHQFKEFPCGTSLHARIDI